MTDLATIRIPVDTKDIPRALREVAKLERTVDNLFKSFQSGASSSRQVNTGLAQLAKTLSGLGMSYNQANSMVRKYYSELQKEAKETQRVAQAKKELVEAQRRADTAYSLAMQRHREEQAELQKAQIATKNYAAEKERLRQKYDPLYRASKLYETSLEEIEAAFQTGAISVNLYQKELNELQLEMQQFQNGVATAGNRFAAMELAAGRSTEGFRHFGMVTQQAGYQVGDFLVQIQSGTNAWVAAGQQLTQLAGLLFLIPGQVGLIAGAVASVLIPLATALGGYFSRTKEAREGTDELTGSLKRQESALKSLRSALADYRFEQEAALVNMSPERYTLQKELDDAVEAAARLEMELESLRIKKEQLRVTPGMMGRSGFVVESAMQFFFGVSEEDLAAAEERVRQAQEDMAALQEKTRQKALELYREEFDAIQRNITLEATRQAYGEDSIQMLELRAQLEKEDFEARMRANGLEGQKLEILVAQHNRLVDMNTEYETTLIKQKNGWELAMKLKEELEKAARVNLAKVFTDADGPAQTILRHMEGILGNMRAAVALQSLERNNLATQYSLYGQGRVAGEQMVRENQGLYGGDGNVLTDFNYYKTKTSGSGSRSKKEEEDKVQSYLDKLDRELNKRKELIGVYGEQERAIQIYHDLIEQAADGSNKLSDTELQNIAKVMAAREEQIRQMEEQAKLQEQVANTIASSMETAFTGIITGTKSIKDAFMEMSNQILMEITKIVIRQAIIAPMMKMMGFPSFGGSGGGFAGLVGDLVSPVMHNGGVVGGTPGMTRNVSPLAFAGAPRYHTGGVVGLKPDEVPIIAQKGERIIPKGGSTGNVVVQMTINTPDANSFRYSQNQIVADMARAMSRSQRNL